MRMLLALGAALLLSIEPTPLFNGKTLAGWTTLDGKPITEGWEVSEGTIHRFGKGGDIVTQKDYASFDLSFEWKLAPGANSGLKYHFGTYGGQSIGIEYQLIDPEKPGDSLGKHGVGGFYDLVAPRPGVVPKPVGQWNQSRIVSKGRQLTHYLNGHKSAEIKLDSAAWKAALSASKFREAPDFGSRPGKILLQDHGGEVWFRNVLITEIFPKEKN